MVTAHASLCAFLRSRIPSRFLRLIQTDLANIYASSAFLKALILPFRVLDRSLLPALLLIVCGSEKLSRKKFRKSAKSLDKLYYAMYSIMHKEV